MPRYKAKAIALSTYKAEADDELSFEIGDEIAITATSGKDWWDGELNGKTGCVPRILLKLSVSGKCIADKNHSSEKSDELQFKVGDIISILIKDKGVWFGSLDDKEGWFPTYTVEELVSDEEPEASDPQEDTTTTDTTLDDITPNTEILRDIRRHRPKRQTSKTKNHRLTAPDLLSLEQQIDDLSSDDEPPEPQEIKPIKVKKTDEPPEPQEIKPMKVPVKEAPFGKELARKLSTQANDGDKEEGKVEPEWRRILKARLAAKKLGELDGGKKEDAKATPAVKNIPTTYIPSTTNTSSGIIPEPETPVQYRRFQKNHSSFRSTIHSLPQTSITDQVEAEPQNHVEHKPIQQQPAKSKSTIDLMMPEAPAPSPEDQHHELKKRVGFLEKIVTNLLQQNTELKQELADIKRKLQM